MLLVILTEKILLKRFTKKELQKSKQKEIRIEKVLKKSDKLYVKGKRYNNSFNSWMDKNVIMYISEYFPKPKSFGTRVKVELYLFNYVTKADLNKCSRC